MQIVKIIWNRLVASLYVFILNDCTVNVIKRLHFGYKYIIQI